MTEHRVLPLEGVHNFRDYGGYASAHGGTVKRGLLWRSAQHGDATDADLAAINQLGIKTVVDLRGPSEREAKPCRRPDGFNAQLFTYPKKPPALPCIPKRQMAWSPLRKRGRLCCGFMMGSHSAKIWCPC